MATKLVVDCSTGITTEVELTAEEIAQREVDAAAYAVAEAEREAEATAKPAAVNKPPAPPPPPMFSPPPPPPATTKYSTSVGFLPSGLIVAVTRPPRYLLIVLECYCA